MLKLVNWVLKSSNYIQVRVHTLPSTQICGSIEVAIFSRSGRPFFLRVNYTWDWTIFKKEAIVFGRSSRTVSITMKVQDNIGNRWLKIVSFIIYFTIDYNGAEYKEDPQTSIIAVCVRIGFSFVTEENITDCSFITSS